MRDKEAYIWKDIPIAYLNYRWQAPYFREHHHFLANLYRWEKKPTEEILKLQHSIKTRGLDKPVIVKQADYTEKFDGLIYYVVVGNRRLCALRSMGFGGTVACIIALEADNWQDNTMATKIFFGE